MSFPLYQYPKRANEVGEIEWNYTKFLIDRQGRVVRRYGPAVDPLAFEGDVSADSAMLFLLMCDVTGGTTAPRTSTASVRMLDRSR